MGIGGIIGGALGLAGAFIQSRATSKAAGRQEDRLRRQRDRARQQALLPNPRLDSGADLDLGRSNTASKKTKSRKKSSTATTPASQKVGGLQGETIADSFKKLTSRGVLR